MSISAIIIADSISPTGSRLTTYVLEYPRFIHSEVCTHRVFSKNAASSRAIPIEKMIEQVMTNPAMPVWWGKNQSGMQAKEELDDMEKTVGKPNYIDGHYESVPMVTPREAAKERWLQARNSAVAHAKQLMELGCHKQLVNRILEPWFNIRVILSGTEFANFFALRAHPDAQPELQALAYKMLEAYNASEPARLKVGDWHVPFADKIDRDRLIALVKGDREEVDFDLHQEYNEAKRKIAIARCARTSYFNYEGKDDYAADIKLCDKLFGSTPRHLSPTEHVAQCLNDNRAIGNYRGWKQYRYTFEDQSLTDDRIVKKAY